MSDIHKTILKKANAAVMAGNHEGFLKFSHEDTVWTFVGDKTLTGKEAVRQWMKTTYEDPPVVKVDHLISEGDFLTAVGEVTMVENGTPTRYTYCDVWRFQQDKLIELRAFVIKAS